MSKHLACCLGNAIKHMKVNNMNLVDEAYREDGLLAKVVENYQPRPQQAEFSKEIQAAILAKQPFVGEAPTGVGKSLAALIPAAEIILNEDAKVVVVTSSIVLQEQYVKKDIPLLIKLLGTPLSYTSIKGRGNYVCQIKAQEQSISGNLFNSGSDEYAKVLTFAVESKTGDFSELGFVPSQSTYQQFAATEEYECTGKLCPAYSSCHYYRERKKAMASQIVVCNYHFFFTAQKAMNMLPDGVRVVIMDEGHEIGDIALNFLEQKYSRFSWRNINTYVTKASKALPPHKKEKVESFKIAVNMNDILFSQESALDVLTRLFQKHTYKEYWTLSPGERSELSDVMFSHYQTLVHRKESLEAHLDLHGLPSEEASYWHELYSDEEISWQNALEKLRDTFSAHIRFLREFFMYENTEVPVGYQMIYWLQNHASNGVSLHAKPPMPASFTAPLLEPEQTGYTPVIMSATLSANQKFDFISSELGLPATKHELIVNSPFDLANNLLWYLPENCPAGNDERHTDYALQEMHRIIHALGGKTLCLFTSNLALNKATVFLRNQLPARILVLSQHETPKRTMIETLKMNPSVVLLGTRSFFTGVDIQGQNLSAVLIDKFPFPMIGDPVNDYLMNQPGGFRSFTLPSAIVTMKQGIGRLNRTMTDKGIVSVMDGRLSTSSYKNAIFSSFDFKIRGVRKWDDVIKYIEEEL